MRNAPFWRRLAALVYDAFIVFSFLLFVTAIALTVTQRDSFLDYRITYLSYLILCLGLFLTWLWKKSGQTLGMLAWKIKLVDNNHHLLTWKKAWLRYFISVVSVGCGAGLLWCLIDKNKQSLHDKLSNTKVILL